MCGGLECPHLLVRGNDVQCALYWCHCFDTLVVVPSTSDTSRKPNINSMIWVGVVVNRSIWQLDWIGLNWIGCQVVRVSIFCNHTHTDKQALSRGTAYA